MRGAGLPTWLPMLALLAGVCAVAEGQLLELPSRLPAWEATLPIAGPLLAAGPSARPEAVTAIEPWCDDFGVLLTAVEPWAWQVLPEGLIYRSYLAGGREPRMASLWEYERDKGWLWDLVIGGRVGLLRYGTSRSDRPEGWQVDIEAAAFPRLDMDDNRDLISVDFRGGVPITYGAGRWQAKLAYYHLSSHLGDEYLLKTPDAARINFSRDVLLAGGSVFLSDNVRAYGEVGWAFLSDGGSEPWEFQFGLEYSPVEPLALGGAPFAAINAHLREEVSFGGSLTVQAGWQWRGRSDGRRFRLGVQYFNGKSEQFEFFDEHEELAATGLWFDY